MIIVNVIRLAKEFGQRRETLTRKRLFSFLLSKNSLITSCLSESNLRRYLSVISTNSLSRMCVLSERSFSPLYILFIYTTQGGKYFND